MALGSADCPFKTTAAKDMEIKQKMVFISPLKDRNLTFPILVICKVINSKEKKKNALKAFKH